MLGTAPPPAAAAPGYNIGQNFPSALAIGAAAIVCTLALLAFYFCRYVSLGGGDAGGSLNNSGGGVGGDSGEGAGHLEKIPVVEASEVAGRIKGGEFCAVCLTDFQQQGQQQQRRVDLAAPTDRLRFLPHCAHCFHCDCVDDWLRKHLFCPVCRTSLVADAPAAGTKPSEPGAAPGAAAPPPPPPPDQQLELRIDVMDPGADQEATKR